MCIFSDLVPKILLDVFKCRIKLSKVFEVTFPTKQWDGGLDHREWLASMMKKAKAQDFTRKAVKEKPDAEWDVCVLSAAMKSLDVCCDDAMTKACDEVRQSRNALYHRSKTEVSHDEFTQCVASVRCLIEQALRPYFPKGDSDGYLTQLDRAACSEFL